MEITNSVVKVRDIKDLLLVLETRENYQKLNESLDEEARVYAEEYCGVLLDQYN